MAACPTITGTRSHLASNQSLSVDEVRNHLMSRSLVSSSMGAQLARVRDGLGFDSGHHDETASVERRLLRSAVILRFMDGFTSTRHFYLETPTTRRLAARLASSEGYLATGVLRSFYRWQSQSEFRGLAEISTWLHGQLGGNEECVEDLAKNFRSRENRRLYAEASELEAEAEVALGNAVARWNRDAKRVGA